MCNLPSGCWESCDGVLLQERKLLDTYWPAPLPLQAHQRPSVWASPGQQSTLPALSGNGPLSGRSSLSVFGVGTNCMFCVFIISLLVLMPDVLHIVQLKGGVRLGKQHLEWTSHSEYPTCGAERSTDVHGLVPVHHCGAVPPCCLRSVQDQTSWQRHQDVQVSKKNPSGLHIIHQTWKEK